LNIFVRLDKAELLLYLLTATGLDRSTNNKQKRGPKRPGMARVRPSLALLPQTETRFEYVLNLIGHLQHMWVL
jgi:hypothetical protein